MMSKRMSKASIFAESSREGKVMGMVFRPDFSIPL
jgi:hypothetical protein